MENSEFPPNSDASKNVINTKNITRITTNDPIRKKKSLRKQFVETFIGGDLKGAVRYGVLDVLLPASKDASVEVITAIAERLFFGESRRRGSRPPQSGPFGYVSYNRMSTGSRPSILNSSQRAISRTARARHDFDEIVLDSRTEAEEVIDRLFDLVDRYEQATVADLYDLVGTASNHTDHKWGWTDLRGSGVSRIRDGYLLDLPEPEPI